MAEPGPGGYLYRAGYLAPAEGAALARRLHSAAGWQRERLHLYGRSVAVPRLLAWYGEPGLNYRYSGRDHRCDGWLAELADLAARIAAEHGVDANLVLVNRYRDGSDYMGWHTDAEQGLGRVIASVSLGATRRFLLRPPDREASERLDLEHGSLLLMDGALRHALPRTRRPVGERINLTFRRVAPR
ncbi:MAG: alpha-ketoglutarate-dependent dioxygenase AlkB family protein [Pseudomonadota bacterium]